MNRETEPPPNPNRQQVANMTDVLAQFKRSGNIHFVKALAKTAILHSRAKLHVPQQFVEKNGDKFEQLVTLRVQTPTGQRSDRSWPVRVCVFATSKVTLVGGWTTFVIDNGLQKGDYVVFLLREDARSEFVVHFFRGPRAFPYFPDKGERSDEEEDEEENESSDSENLEENTSQQDEQQDQAFNRDNIREGNPAPLQHHTGNPPRFSKRLVASNIARPTGEQNSGQFEFPANFERRHGEHIHNLVKLQGQRLKGRGRASVFPYG